MYIDMETGGDKQGGYTGPGGLWKCYRKWENMSMNQMQEWKQSQTGFGFVAVSSGNIAVGGLWLQAARKWTQTFLSSPNCCRCKSRRNNHHVEGWIKANPDYRGLTTTTTTACWCRCVCVKCSMCKAEGQRQRWWEEKKRGLQLIFRGDKWWLLCDGSTDSWGCRQRPDRPRNYPKCEKIAPS